MTPTSTTAAPSRNPSQRQRPPPPYPSNPIVAAQQAKWYFKPQELATLTPSVLDGMDPATEVANRLKGVSFISQACILLHLPQTTLYTASIFLNRFFIRYSMVDKPDRAGFHHYAIAATALYLATKVEENCKKIKEMIVACCRVALKDTNLVVDEQSKDYWRWRDTILMNEDLMLEALCFDITIEKPYKFLYDFLRHFQIDHEPVLRNTGWAFLNDSNMTILSLLHPPRTVATAALYFASKICEFTIPDDEEGRPWWEVLDVPVRDIKSVINIMADRYEDGTVPRKGGKYERTPPEDTTNMQRTRRDKTPDTPTRSGSQKREREESSRNGESRKSPLPSRKEEPNAKRQKRDPGETSSHSTNSNTKNLATRHSRERSNQSNSYPTSHQPPPPPPLPHAPSPPQNSMSHARPQPSANIPPRPPAPSHGQSQSPSNVPPPPPPPASEDPNDIQARIDSIVNGAAAASSNNPSDPSSGRRYSSHSSGNRPQLDRRGGSWERENDRGGHGGREHSRNRNRSRGARDRRNGDRGAGQQRRGSGGGNGDYRSRSRGGYGDHRNQRQRSGSPGRYGDHRMQRQRSGNDGGYGGYSQRSGSGDHWEANQRGHGVYRDRDGEYGGRDRRRSSGSSRQENAGTTSNRSYSGEDRLEDAKARYSDRDRRGMSEEGEL